MRISVSNIEFRSRSKDYPLGLTHDKLSETFLGFVLLASCLDWINSEV